MIGDSLIRDIERAKDARMPFYKIDYKSKMSLLSQVVPDLIFSDFN